jgi:thiol-disulfide isomerase/thioredoxin
MEEPINLKHVECDSLNIALGVDYNHIHAYSRFSFFKEKLEKKYTGLPLHDSVMFFHKIEFYDQYTYDMYGSKIIEKKDYLEEIKYYKIDTLTLSPIPLKQGLVLIVGFYKDKQFIMADVNRNYNFGDDIKYEFDINFRNTNMEDPAILNKLPLSTYNYERYRNKKVLVTERKMIFYPTKLGSAPVSDHKEFEYTSKYVNKDCWTGETLLDNEWYDIYYDGRVVIKPRKIPFSKDNSRFNEQFMHYAKDTVVLASNKKFVIDSVDSTITKIYLRELINAKKMYGNNLNFYLKDFTIDDLENKKINLNAILKNKKYTLIDFWGTWCGPCIELTPKLKKLHQENESKLNMIGIARDKNSDLVKNYVKKHNLAWTNAFIDFNDKESLIEKLQIQYYPTLLLLDASGKILYRGSSENLEEIKKIIK